MCIEINVNNVYDEVKQYNDTEQDYLLGTTEWWCIPESSNVVILLKNGEVLVSEAS